jgi:hypothetical protein
VHGIRNMVEWTITHIMMWFTSVDRVMSHTQKCCPFPERHSSIGAQTPKRPLDPP